MVLLLENGQQRSGEINAWDGETLSLRIDIAGGSASMILVTMPFVTSALQERILTSMLYKLEKNPARSDGGLFALFEAFYQQLGGKHLRYMDVGELGMFVRYARFCLANEKPLARLQ